MNIQDLNGPEHLQCPSCNGYNVQEEIVDNTDPGMESCTKVEMTCGDCGWSDVEYYD